MKFRKLIWMHSIMPNVTYFLERDYNMLYYLYTISTSEYLIYFYNFFEQQLLCEYFTNIINSVDIWGTNNAILIRLIYNLTHRRMFTSAV